METVTAGGFFHDVSSRVVESRAVPQGHTFHKWTYKYRFYDVPVKVTSDGGEFFEKAGEPINHTGWFFRGGTVKTLDMIPDTRENSVLRGNMIGNNMPAVIDMGFTMAEFDPEKDVVVHG
jgi:hypothetical protein